LYLLSIQDSTGTGKQNFVFQQYNTDDMKVVKSKKIGLFKSSTNYPGGYRVNFTVDKNDNVWLMAPYTGSCSIGSYNKTLTGLEKEQLLIKLDNNLNVADVWPIHKTLNNATFAAGFGFDSLGNMLIAGTVKDSIDVDLSGGTQWVKSTLPPPHGAQHGTLYFNCYDKNMNLLWTKTIGDTSRLLGRHVEFGYRKNIYLWGAARGTIDVDLIGTNTITTPANNMAEIYLRYKWNTASYTTDIPQILTTPLAMSLYPNPATSQVNVTFDEGGATKGQITVSDINGRPLRLVKYTGERSVAIPTGSLASGMYLLTVDIEGRQKETKTFIKQ
jgi:hypothetical protein